MYSPYILVFREIKVIIWHLFVFFVNLQFAKLIKGERSSAEDILKHNRFEVDEEAVRQAEQLWSEEEIQGNYY